MPVSAGGISAQLIDEALIIFQDYAIRQGINVGRIAINRYGRRMPIKPGLQFFAADAATRLARDAAKAAISRSTTLKNVGTRVNDRLTTVASNLGGGVGNKAFEAEYWLLGGRDDIPSMLKAYGRHQKVLKAYNSPTGRFIRSGTNRFAVDYATMQLTNIATHALEEVIPSIGPTDQDDKMNWSPFGGNIVDPTLAMMGGDTNPELVNLVATAILNNVIGSGISKFRRKQATLNDITFSGATTFGRRLAENTREAKAYYGNRIPEVGGNLTGSVFATYALGGDLQMIAANLGARGVANAAAGFYNVGKPRQGKLPYMRKAAKGTRKVPKVKKVKQTVSATKYAYDQYQGKLF